LVTVTTTKIWISRKTAERFHLAAVAINADSFYDMSLRKASRVKSPFDQYADSAHLARVTPLCQF